MKSFLVSLLGLLLRINKKAIKTMRRISEKTMEVSFTKRIVAIVMMVSYISVMSPLSLFAESVTNDTEAKRTVSVKEEKSEVLISAEEGGILT